MNDNRLVSEYRHDNFKVLEATNESWRIHPILLSGDGNAKTCDSSL